MPDLELVHDNDSHAVPLCHVHAALERIEYASVVRVMFRMLQITGCRIKELDSMDPHYLFGEWLYWPLGKNQRTWRKERLPADFIEELRIYRENSRVPANRFFGVSSDSFCRYFNRDIRPLLPAAWRQKRLRPTRSHIEVEYVLQLKGMRKNFQTIDFAVHYAKFKDAGVALEFTSKRMKHSSKHITAHHYVENFDALGIRSFGDLDQKTLLLQHQQRRIIDFLR